MSDQGKGSASASAAAPAPGSDTYKGWLFKWTNYLKGYQRRWFVLSNGLLSYYRYKKTKQTNSLSVIYIHISSKYTRTAELLRIPVAAHLRRWLLSWTDSSGLA